MSGRRRPLVLHLLCADRPSGFTGSTSLRGSDCLAAGLLAADAEFAEHGSLVVGRSGDMVDARSLGAPELSLVSAPLGRAPLATRALAREIDRAAPGHVIAWGPFAREAAAEAGWPSDQLTEAAAVLPVTSEDRPLSDRGSLRERLGIAAADLVVACVADHPAETHAYPSVFAATIAALEIGRPVTVLVSSATPGVREAATHLSKTHAPCSMVVTDAHPAALARSADAAVVGLRRRPDPAAGEAALRVSANAGVPAVAWKGDVGEELADGPLADWLTDFPETPLIGSVLARVLGETGARSAWLNAARRAISAEINADMSSTVRELAAALGQPV